MKAPFVPIVGLSDVRSQRHTNGLTFGWFFVQLLFTLNSNQYNDSSKISNIRNDPKVYYLSNSTNNNVIKSEYMNEVEKERNIIVNKYYDKFNYINRVSNDVYCVFLNKEEYSELSSLKHINIFEVTKDKIVKQRFKENEQKGKRLLQASNDIEKERNFIVRSIENWKYNLLNNQSKVTPLSNGYYSVTNVSYNSLINDPHVLYFEPFHPIKYMNANSITFMQKAQGISGTFQKEYSGREIWNDFRLLLSDITGADQIVTVKDSCIDLNHNFFYDQNEKFPLNSENMNHRKVVKYQMNGEYSCVSDHGTHVAGTLAGKSFDDESIASLFNGHAPDAKLYFIDDSYSDYQDIYENMERLNSGIFSNSWGNDYIRIFTEMFDKLAWNYSNILTTFAAGNEGTRQGLCSPGDSKNVLTVGSVELSEGPPSFSIVNSRNQYQLNGQFSKDILFTNRDHIPKLNNIKISTTPKTNTIYLSPNSENYSTSFSKCINAEGGPCSFVIALQDEDLYPTDVPVFTVNDAIYETLSTSTQSWTLETTSTVTYKGKSDFSSLGTGNNGITKPDIYAPGSNIYSAKLQTEQRSSIDLSFNSIKTMSGTSMATPALSGEATLVRQYFMEGYYPSGFKNERDSFTPSSSLLKAVLIASSYEIGGQITDNTKAENEDIGNKGYFHQVKATILSSIYSIYKDNIKINSRSAHEYIIETTIIDSLNVAISYLDPPSDNFFDDTHILRTAVNLVVEDPEGNIYYGNQHENKMDEIYTTNSIIRIPKQNTMIGQYKIYVISGPWDDNDFNISYALVIQGSIDRESFHEITNNTEKTCPGNCSGNGECINGRCQCSQNTTGTTCHMKVNEYNNNLEIVEVSSVDGYEWYSVKINPEKKYVLRIGNNSYEMYGSFYKICIGEDKESISNDKLQCYYSTFYDKEFGPFEFTTDTVYIAVVTTKRKNPFLLFSFSEYNNTNNTNNTDNSNDSNNLNDANNSNQVTMGVASFAVLIVFFVIFILAAVAAAVYIGLTIWKKSKTPTVTDDGQREVSNQSIGVSI